MTIDELLVLYREDKRLLYLLDLLEQDKEPTYISNLVGSLPAFWIAAIFLKTKYTQLYIASDAEEAHSVAADLKNILPQKNVLLFEYSWKKNGFFESYDNHNLLSRTQVVDSMSRFPENQIIISYPEAIQEKVVGEKQLKNNTLHLKIAAKIDMDFMLDVLIEYGFERVDFVYEPGEFSIRGGIVDVFSFGSTNPYRIELFGNEIESIRTFEAQTQLSLQKISELTIIPNFTNVEKEEVFQLIFDYLPADSIVWIKDAQSLQENLNTQYNKAYDEYNLRANSKQSSHPFYNKEFSQLYVDTDELTATIMGFKNIVLSTPKNTTKVISIEAIPQPSFNKNFGLLIDTLKEYSKNGIRNFIWSDNTKQIERFYHIFNDLKSGVEFLPIYTSLQQGFLDKDLQIACYTDHQIFDRFHKYATKQSYSRDKMMTLKALQDLQPGDFVTHIDHGVGRFSGLQKLEINGKQQEAVRILYKDNDILYVNIHSLHKISKFSGKEGIEPKMHKLGSEAWNNLKEKTKKKVKEIAFDLIQLYAKRKLQKGYAYAKDSYLQFELEASFMYEDTPDQLKATIDVKADMEKPFPMDRLICGDVGFGKTEIAMRAAFKAACENKQVAILVPTTILAWQHYKSFKQRFSDFPLTIDYISRFKSTKEKKDTLLQLEKGKVDVVIGTHALLSKDIKFKDLGLLIIDEEQKFGVGAKEKLRTLATDVDTLTLTATPIPRTLKFSMMGARDFSNIMTPPPNRQPVTTEVITFDAEVLKEAIEFELYRGGQIFFVHNRVKGIEDIEKMIRSMVPQASIRTAHGQLEGDALEAVMMDFINAKFDILVSTNIIEAGLDIPNANTIIINNAHHFGLSDLHQMRGRVGRSNRKAFCYLLCPMKSTLTPEARKRLQTLEEFSDLGSGFQIAMRDLDIRGAGNLLGAEQSGFISEIGFDTYQKILEEAITELKFTEFKELFDEQIKSIEHFANDCSIETDCEMLIPQEYVTSTEERLRLYTELDNIKNEEELKDYADRMFDRFGKIPQQVQELFNGVRIRWIARKLGFIRIILKSNKLRLYFVENQNSPYYESEIFRNLMDNIQSNYRKATLKQTTNSLLLIYEHIYTLNDVEKVLSELMLEK
jgi:transcription-repair coupling factor (superfamily II helicase)